MTRLPAEEQAELLALEVESPNIAHEVEELEVEGENSWLRGLILNPKTLVSFLAALIILIFLFTTVFKNLDFAMIGKEMAQANLLYFAAGFVIYYLAFIVRGLRWQILLRNAGVETQPLAAASSGKVQEPANAGSSLVVPKEEGRLPAVPALIEALYLSWFVNCIVPAKLGDAYRSFLIKRDYNVSFSRSLGTILAERILDILVLFSLLLVSGLFIGSRLLAQSGLVIAGGAVLVVVILIGLVVMVRAPQVIARFLPKRLQELFIRFQHGMVTSFSRRSLPQVLALTGMVWLMEGGRLFFITRAIDAHDKDGNALSLSLIIFLALASSLLTTLPITPAGLGLVEGVMVGVLSQVIYPLTQAQAQAAAITFLDRIINYWSIVLIGLVVYIISTARHGRRLVAKKQAGQR